MEKKDELVEFYGYQAEIFSKSYNMMGRLLDKNFVREEVERRKWSEVYIYGGGNLGIQLYRALKPFVNILSVVDKKGKLLIDCMDNIPVIDMGVFREEYENQPVIVTPLKFYREIYNEIKEFVTENNIIFLEEFGEL